MRGQSKVGNRVACVFLEFVSECQAKSGTFHVQTCWVLQRENQAFQSIASQWKFTGDLIVNTAQGARAFLRIYNHPIYSGHSCNWSMFQPLPGMLWVQNVGILLLLFIISCCRLHPEVAESPWKLVLCRVSSSARSGVGMVLPGICASCSFHQPRRCPVLCWVMELVDEEARELHRLSKEATECLAGCRNPIPASQQVQKQNR